VVDTGGSWSEESGDVLSGRAIGDSVCAGGGHTGSVEDQFVAAAKISATYGRSEEKYAPADVVAVGDDVMALENVFFMRNGQK
jgi:hypothetical protein